VPPELTIVIPTQGRHTLPRCLESMRPEFHGGYRPQVLVVADTHSGLLMDVKAAAQAIGAEYLEHDAGTHNWGYPQLQYGYERADGDYILNIGDDDVYEAGAFETIRRVIDDVGAGPILFRALMHHSATRSIGGSLLLWRDRGNLERGTVTGQNFAMPNVPGRTGFWWDDFCHMEAVIGAWGGLVHWREEVIARCY
jgi:hypothetical protein